MLRPDSDVRLVAAHLVVPEVDVVQVSVQQSASPPACRVGVEVPSVDVGRLHEGAVVDARRDSEMAGLVEEVGSVPVETSDPIVRSLNRHVGRVRLQDPLVGPIPVDHRSCRARGIMGELPEATELELRREREDAFIQLGPGVDQTPPCSIARGPEGITFLMPTPRPDGDDTGAIGQGIPEAALPDLTRSRVRHVSLPWCPSVPRQCSVPGREGSRRCSTGPRGRGPSRDRTGARRRTLR